LGDLQVLEGLGERALCDEEKMRKDKAIRDLERTTLMEEVSGGKNRSIVVKKG
jgi:hypothetical protein